MEGFLYWLTRKRQIYQHMVGFNKKCDDKDVPKRQVLLRTLFEVIIAPKRTIQQKSINEWKLLLIPRTLESISWIVHQIGNTWKNNPLILKLFCSIMDSHKDITDTLANVIIEAVKANRELTQQENRQCIKLLDKAMIIP